MTTDNRLEKNNATTLTPGTALFSLWISATVWNPALRTVEKTAALSDQWCQRTGIFHAVDIVLSILGGICFISLAFDAGRKMPRNRYTAFCLRFSPWIAGAFLFGACTLLFIVNSSIIPSIEHTAHLVSRP